MFAYVFLLFLVFLTLLDFIFLPKSARRAWKALVLAFAVAASMAVFTDSWSGVAERLGVGRAVDILIYSATALLVREMFLARARYTRQEAQITQIVRAIAIQRAVKIE